MGRYTVAGQGRQRAPAGVDVTVPSVARIYDYALGGKDNYAVDREMADAIMEQVPEVKEAARANRRFLARAVEFCADAGIRQFLDLGTGLQEKYQKASAPGVFRGRDAIGRFFAGFDLVDPGLVSPSHWRSGDAERGRPGGEWVLAGVGRKPYPVG
ncbi:MAG: SAM-dependent methyltransferase [Actinomadura sp.]